MSTVDSDHENRTRATTPVVPMWASSEVRALRQARRMSVREFGAHLALDTSLRMANAEVWARFGQLTAGATVRVAAVPAAGVRHLVRHPIDGKLMTLIESGPFQPVNAAVKPRWLPAYYIDVHLATNGDYMAFANATGHRSPARRVDGRYRHALDDAPVHLPWLDARAYAVWACKPLPTLIQLQRAAGGDAGMVSGRLAEWYTAPDGPRRHRPIAGGDTKTGFRCVISAVEMLELLAI
jgi:formylglycine-generating enzyme required for sulfatase activity